MRPVIKIPKEPLDYAVEGIGIAALLFMIILPVIYWGDLPDMVPRHYNGQGLPDAWTSKESLWILPAISLVLFSGLWFVSTIPHKFNYGQPITPENAFAKYKTSTRTVRILNATIAVAFAYIFYSTFQIALGKSAGLGTWFLPVFLIATLFLPILLLGRGQRKRPNRARS